jgi:hypothetical protein
MEVDVTMTLGFGELHHVGLLAPDDGVERE